MLQSVFAAPRACTSTTDVPPCASNLNNLHSVRYACLGPSKNIAATAVDHGNTLPTLYKTDFKLFMGFKVGAYSHA